MTAQHINRRDLFRGRAQPRGPVEIAPPWLDADQLAACIACGDCIKACPEDVLTANASGRPVVTFEESGCTFCGECASACPEDLFRSVDTAAWDQKVELSGACLLAQGVTCQLCSDFCDAEALRFDLSGGPVGGLDLDADACTGCGMCVGSCPAEALVVRASATGMAA